MTVSDFIKKARPLLVYFLKSLNGVTLRASDRHRVIHVLLQQPVLPTWSFNTSYAAEDPARKGEVAELRYFDTEAVASGSSSGLPAAAANPEVAVLLLLLLFVVITPLLLLFFIAVMLQQLLLLFFVGSSCCCCSLSPLHHCCSCCCSWWSP
jgi:hypothetical protein